MNFRRETNRAGHRRGFTVIEAFVGIAVLLIGVVGPMVLVNKNFQSARFSRDQITAYYLAQEAIEVVRQVRDDNLLARSSNPSRAWDFGLDSCRVNNRGCVVNGIGVAQKIWACDSTDCVTDKTLLVDDTGRYNHCDPSHGGSCPSNQVSNFKRYVKIDSNDLIHVFVEFYTGKYEQPYKTVSVISDWTPTP